MRVVFQLLSLLTVCFSTCTLAADLPPTPRLLVDQKDLTTLKQKIAGPFATQWKTLRTEVDQSLADPVKLPPRGGNWSHNYVCPEHGARLNRGKKIGDWRWEHTCPVGPHTLKGDPSKATTDFDGNGIMGVHLDYSEQLVKLGLVYQVTSDAKYAQRAREILLAYADKYESYPMHDNQGKPGTGARVASQSLTEASWLIGVVQGADLVWSTLSSEDRATIEKKLLRPPLDQVIIPKTYGIHNIQCRQNSAIGLVGFLLNDDKLIHLAIDDEKTGFRTQISKGVRDDGMWLEGASGYHFFTIDGLWPLAEAARHCGINLYTDRFKSMFDGPMNLAMPDLRLPNFNDSGVVDLSSRADSYELAYARWNDPKYLALINPKKRGGRLALLYGSIDLPSAKPTSGGTASRNLTDSGFAILQHGERDDATWLCLKYGPHGGGHGHFDKNHFVLWSHGSILVPDAGTHAYGSPLHSSWDKHSLAHNTLVVDEKSQEPAQGKCIAFGSSEGIHYAITDAGDIYKDADVRFIRSVAMIDPDCIVVIDQISAPAEHTFDLAAHLNGKWESLPAGEAWGAPKANGYSVLRDLTARTSGDRTTLDVRHRDDEIALTVAGNEPTQIITGTGVGETTRDRVPIAILRRRTRATTYVWSITRSEKPTALSTVPVAGAEAVAVEMERSGKKVFLTTNPQGSTIELKIPSGTRQISDRFTVIR